MLRTIKTMTEPQSLGDVDANDTRAVLEPCFGRGNLAVEPCDLAGHGSHGYASIVLARAYRRLGGVDSTATLSRS